MSVQVLGHCWTGPVDLPLPGVLGEATDGQVRVAALAIPASAAALETGCQAFALRFGQARADLQPLGREPGVLRHLLAFGDVAVERLEGVASSATMRTGHQPRLGRGFGGSGLQYRCTELWGRCMEMNVALRFLCPSNA